MGGADSLSADVAFRFRPQDQNTSASYARADDPLPGTPASASKKLYEAIRGNGGTTRLVIFPHEPHWYAADKTNERFVYEMLSWFNEYVRDAGKRD